MTKQRKQIDIIKTLKRAPPDHELQANNLFLPIDIDDYRLSIQESAGHHSTPKTDNLEATKYTNFEVALYFKKTPSRFLKLRLYQYFQLWLDYEDDDNETGTMIFVQMPYNKVNELYDILSHEKVLKLLNQPENKNNKIEIELTGYEIKIQGLKEKKRQLKSLILALNILWEWNIKQTECEPKTDTRTFIISNVQMSIKKEYMIDTIKHYLNETDEQAEKTIERITTIGVK